MFANLYDVPFTMRNIFDQYKDPENRLSHALAVCLDEDRALLKGFLRWLEIKPPQRPASLHVLEQRLPGEPIRVERDDERRGLPDIVICNDDGWCVFIESKVEATLESDQIERHRQTLVRRGYKSVHPVTLTKERAPSPKRTVARTWPGVYEWLGKAKQQGEWASRLREFLRVAESRFSHDEYLTAGTLTMFDGFPFSDEYSYTYSQAKRHLKLALDELRNNRRLKKLGIDDGANNRKKITGRDSALVWGYLQLRERPKDKPHTAYPHLTLALHEDHLEVSVTIPNDVNIKVKRRLNALGVDGVAKINKQILRNGKRLIKAGATIDAVAMQRHYISQSSDPKVDATLIFRLETSQPMIQRRSGKRDRDRVKPQPEWVGLFVELAKQKMSNIQFQYRVQLPWGTKGLDSRESLNLIVDSWLALKPLLDAIRKDA